MWFTRAGQGSGPLRANLARHVGDDPRVVADRRRALSDRLGRPVIWMNQTHSTRVEVVADDAAGWTGPEWGPLECDGVVVDARGWTDAPAAAVMVADCLPVLLSTSHGRVVAAVHAGRAGLVGGILSEAIARMRDLAGAAAPVEALIGPAICGRCYEVPAALRDQVAATRPAAWSETSWGTPALDLPAAAVAELRALGVGTVRWRGPCTREDPGLHSYRRDPACGRQAGLVVPAAGAPSSLGPNGPERPHPFRQRRHAEGGSRVPSPPWHTVSAPEP